MKADTNTVKLKPHITKKRGVNRGARVLPIEPGEYTGIDSAASMGESRPKEPRLDPEIAAHYGGASEATRLATGVGRLERERTLEILERFLPPPPATVLDVGGGAGVYALALAARGYEVHLVDPVPLHVAQARETSGAAAHPLASVARGDARALAPAEETCDGVLLLGPLYHLTERAQRLQALREARRVLRPGGCVFAAAISRFASLLSGLSERLLGDPAFAAMVERALHDGQHRNPTADPRYFTTAFFHRPEELRDEVSEAGLDVEALLAVEGPGWLAAGFDALWDDPAQRKTLLRLLRQVEGEPELMGASAHLIAVGHRA
jgi:SAM-dependent methyltransferase